MGKDKAFTFSKEKFNKYLELLGIGTKSENFRVESLDKMVISSKE